MRDRRREAPISWHTRNDWNLGHNLRALKPLYCVSQGNNLSHDFTLCIYIYKVDKQGMRKNKMYVFCEERLLASGLGNELSWTFTFCRSNYKVDEQDIRN